MTRTRDTVLFGAGVLAAVALEPTEHVRFAFKPLGGRRLA